MPQRHALKALPSHSLLAVASARCIGARACRIQFKAFCWKLAGTDFNRLPEARLP